jgi:hypothetical protein
MHIAQCVFSAPNRGESAKIGLDWGGVGPKPVRTCTKIGAGKAATSWCSGRVQNCTWIPPGDAPANDMKCRAC